MRARRAGHGSFRLTVCGVASITLSSIGCGGASLGDLEGPSVSVTLTTTASDPSIATTGEPSGGLLVARVFVSTSSFTLQPCSEEAAEIVLPPRGYDLVTSPVPSEYVTTAVTELCGLRLDIDPLSRNASEGVPEGASMYVQGSDAAGAPFELSSEQSLSLALEANPNSSFGDQPLILAFDLSTWLANIPRAEGMAEIAIELFETQARSSVGLYVDANENGGLDEDEPAVSLQSAPRR
jgi:hypothetical protein